MDLPDFRPSGNQGVDPALYEIENAAMDREGALWAALQEAAPWTGRTLLDLGAGTGFWLPRYADAAETIAVEPDVRLLGAARARPGGARVLYGSAEQIPLPEASVDVVHARFAYFFPHPRWDVRPGLDEVVATLRPAEPGLHQFVVEGWDDPVGTWKHAATVKIAAGVDVEIKI